MVNYRLATPKDSDNIAKLHFETYKGTYVWALLGEEVVQQFYYHFMRSDKTVVMIAEDDDRLVGFRAISLDGTGPVRSMVMNNLWLFFTGFLKAQFTRPVSLFKGLVNWIRNSQQSEGKEAFAKNYGFGVVKNYRGRGIGRLLLIKSEEYLEAIGVKRIEVSIRCDNVVTLNLCRTLGYEITHEFTYFPDTRMYYLVKEF